MLPVLQGHAQPASTGTRRARLVTKDGRCNLELGHTDQVALVLDLWTTLVDTRWRFVLLLFAASFTGSWFFFSLLWYWIARTNGDLDLVQNRTAGHVRCMDNVQGLTSAFLYSLETQTTIGYGGRALTGHCAGSVVLLVVQSLVGVFINVFVCGVVLAKISLPRKRAKTVTFSDTAVVCLKNGGLSLVIRVANLQRTMIIGTKVYGKLIRTTTEDGDSVLLDQVDVVFTLDSGKENLFFVCPLTLYHVLDSSSPFSGLTADSLAGQDFELVVFLEGVAESSGSSCQVRTSYVPEEILWGRSFLPVVTRTREGRYRVDLANFSRTVRVSTPHCSRCFLSDADQVNHNHRENTRLGINHNHHENTRLGINHNHHENTRLGINHNQDHENTKLGINRNHHENTKLGINHNHRENTKLGINHNQDHDNTKLGINHNQDHENTKLGINHNHRENTKLGINHNHHENTKLGINHNHHENTKLGINHNHRENTKLGINHNQDHENTKLGINHNQDQKIGIDNLGFSVIDIHDSADITKM